MKPFACTIAAAALLLAALGGCGGGAAEPAQQPAAPVAAAPLVSVDDLLLLQRRIDPQHPGRGVADYPGNTVEDVPKSYAMVLLAEIERKRHPGTTAFPDLQATAGQWLLDHADENHDGVIGWGVPVAWDAYGDGSVNPASTEYSISTAIVMDALLTWREEATEPRSAEILAVVEQAARPYLHEEVLSPAGLLPYSLRESDRRYDTFNSAMYLAGQLQRLSRLTADAALAQQLTVFADRTVAALLKNRQNSPETGAWYWTYSVQEPNNPNDLPHASYIAAGLGEYVRRGGRLAAEVDLPAVFEHLREFTPPEAQVQADQPATRWIRAWPRFRKDITVPARSYDLGMALHLACTEERLAPLRARLVSAVPDYRTPQGEYRKYPVGSSQQALVVAEYESYLYRGLATCLLASAPATVPVGSARS